MPAHLNQPQPKILRRLKPHHRPPLNTLAGNHNKTKTAKQAKRKLAPTTNNQCDIIPPPETHSDPHNPLFPSSLSLKTIQKSENPEPHKVRIKFPAFFTDSKILFFHLLYPSKLYF
jgi:hypothetical protein